MDFNFGKAVETTKGSEEGSTYVVVAKNKGLKMGIRLFLNPFGVKDSVWIALYFRLRVEAEGGYSITADMAKEAFGKFPFYESKGHASTVGVLPLVAMPTTPTEVYNHYMGFKGAVEENLVNTLATAVEAVGGAFVLDKESLVMVLQEKIADVLPDVKPTANHEPVFLLLPVKKEED